VTQKLFLDNAYTTKFQAEIQSAGPGARGWEVVLSATYFYPESGGQPADRGTIGSVPVLDVQVRGDEIVHYLAGEPPHSPAAAEIQWPRRYDHMQQHTGQHLLTAALIKLFDADTVGFHLGEEAGTIDVTLPAITDAMAEKSEQLCGEWIAAALPVAVEYTTPDLFHRLDLRKKALPDDVKDEIRLIRIGDVDVAHCGGTHLRSTAELQIVKITATEKVRDLTRLSFLAGRRALDDYAQKHKMLADIAGALTCSIEDIPKRAVKMQEDVKQALRELKKARRELISHKVRSELAEVLEAGKHKLYLRRHDGWSPDELKLLAAGMTAADPRLLCCCVSRDADSGAVVLAAGAAADIDMGLVLTKLLPQIDGKGGGRGNFAQGVGDPEKLDLLLSEAKKILSE
jgi:alanyl-tRNA synthetase